MIVINNSYDTVLYDSSRGRIIKKCDFQITADSLRECSLESHLKNCRYFSQAPIHYQPVFPGIYVIPPKTQWVQSGRKFDPLIRGLAVLARHANNEKKLQSFIRRHVDFVGAANIAVETSGGLDTSIIIGIISQYITNINLVGVVSDRFEFRTERHVQELLFSKFESYIKIIWSSQKVSM
jgi:hypothetical protein